MKDSKSRKKGNKKEGAGALAPAFIWKRLCIESEVIHYFVGGTLLIPKQGNLEKPGMKKSSMKKFNCLA